MKDQLKILFVLLAGIIVSASPYLPVNAATADATNHLAFYYQAVGTKTPATAIAIDSNGLTPWTISDADADVRATLTGSTS